MSAKHTQFSFSLCCSFPAISSKSFIAAMYVGYTVRTFLPTRGCILHFFHGANELNGLAEIIYTCNIH